jgi:hypothetical protein
MENLTIEDIQFTDTYLINSGIKHKDIRIEMIDHIACDIEKQMEFKTLSFYDAFKFFMIENKNSLVNKNPFLKAVNKRFFKKLFIEMLTLRSLVIFGTCFLILKQINQFELFVTYFKSINEIFAALFATIFVAFYVYYRFKLRQRYSIISVAFISSYVVYWVNMVFFTKVELHSDLSYLYTSLCLLFVITEGIVLAKYVNYYKTKYELA